MSFNIRLGVANDGENHWDKRKELVLKTIQNFGPDLLGLQEVWHMPEKIVIHILAWWVARYWTHTEWHTKVALKKRAR